MDLDTQQKVFHDPSSIKQVLKYTTQFRQGRRIESIRVTRSFTSIVQILPEEVRAKSPEKAYWGNVSEGLPC